MSVKVGMVSLGCPKNLVDSEVMLGSLAKDGCSITADQSEAEVLIVNTCGFIDRAKQESVDTILEMAKLKQTGKCRRLIVTGCLVQGYVNELKLELPEVDAFLGSADYGNISKIVGDLIGDERMKQPLVKVSQPVWLYDENSPRLLATPRYTAYLKIAEGCDHACAFCSIPQLRGGLRSRTVESVVIEAERLVKGGVREINLISQDTSEYGRDIYKGESRLAQLLVELNKVKDLKWIRMHYLYPAFLGDDLLKAVADCNKVVPYFDLPLQHGDNSMLKAMRRPGNRKSNLEIVRRFREFVPGCAVRTSFIAGYPGETEETFENMLSFIREAQFDRVGVFTYSTEELTPSGTMPNQVPQQVREARQARAMETAALVSAQLLKKRVGSEIEVLVEAPPGAPAPSLDGREHGDQDNGTGQVAPSSGWYTGRSALDAPGVDGKVFFKDSGNRKSIPGDFVKVKITESDRHDLFGEMI